MSDDYTPLSEFQEPDGPTWLVEWDRDEEPQSRETTLAAVAWYGDNFDDEATVTRL